MEAEEVKMEDVHTGEVAGAEEVEQLAEPLHLHVEVHSVAHAVETPAPKEVRAKRRGAADGEVGPAGEVPRAPPAQVRPHERETQRLRCSHANPQISTAPADMG
jgi:hypothetical protein